MTSGPQEFERFAREALFARVGKGVVQKGADAGWATDQARAAIDAYNDRPILSMANSCLRSDWRVEETRTVGLPSEVM